MADPIVTNQPNASTDTQTDLPPVEPPDAGFVVQLFVIPAIVVCVVIAVWLLFGKLAGGERDVNEYVRIIRSENANRRFRAAYELASLINNEKTLQTDEKLLGSLTELLDLELDQKNVEDAETKQFLAVTLGVFQINEGIAPSGQPVNALTTLAKALDDTQPESVRIAAAESLARQAARQEGKIDDPAVVAALTGASNSTETDVRLRAVYALGFFGGSEAVAALRNKLSDSEKDVAYNAAFALIRQDDRSAVNVLRELLNDRTLAETIQLENATEKQNRIEAFQVQALRSLNTALQNDGTQLATLVSLEVESLEKSPFVSVSVEAKSVIEALNKAKAKSSTNTSSTAP